MLQREGVQVTHHHNLWRACRDRLPQLRDAGSKAHVYNSWFDRWRGSSGIRVRTGAEALVQNNVFDAGNDTRAVRVESDSAWDGSGNWWTNGAEATARKTVVFPPPYTYELDPVDTEAQAQALRQRLEQYAGWQATFAALPPPIKPPPVDPPPGATSATITATSGANKAEMALPLEAGHPVRVAIMVNPKQ